MRSTTSGYASRSYCCSKFALPAFPYAQQMKWTEQNICLHRWTQSACDIFLFPKVSQRAENWSIKIKLFLEIQLKGKNIKKYFSLLLFFFTSNTYQHSRFISLVFHNLGLISFSRENFIGSSKFNPFWFFLLVNLILIIND